MPKHQGVRISRAERHQFNLAFQPEEPGKKFWITTWTEMKHYDYWGLCFGPWTSHVTPVWRRPKKELWVHEDCAEHSRIRFHHFSVQYTEVRCFRDLMLLSQKCSAVRKSIQEQTVSLTMQILMCWSYVLYFSFCLLLIVHHGFFIFRYNYREGALIFSVIMALCGQWIRVFKIQQSILSLVSNSID